MIYFDYGDSMNITNNIDIEKGLTDKEIKERIEAKKTNKNSIVPTKTIGEIIKNNLFTLFNLLNFLLALSIALVGSYKNLLFMGGVICNTLISIVQEIRTKKIIDKLSLLSTTKAKVIRNGKTKEIKIEDIVVDDIIKFKAGEEITVDTIIKKGTCEVNESFLTGEEEPILKKENDMILSGSFIVSGSIIGKVEHVGEDNYANKISNEARYVKKANSILLESLNKVIKYISILVVPLGIILFLKQLSLTNDYTVAVINSVAAIIGMIPEGLVLLTSTVMAVGIIKLSKYKVLVQDLYAIEMLARTDVLCLDKTGTLTEGKMKISGLISVNEQKNKIENILGNFAYFSKDENATMKAIKNKFDITQKLNITNIIPFNSERKYSALILDNFSYLLGAPEFLIEKNNKIYEKIDIYNKDYRVLVLCKSNYIKTEELTKSLDIISIILIEDVIRKKAKETISYFKKQNVNIKVISGDNPITVSNIAKKVGIENYDKYIDMTNITMEKIIDIVDDYTIFGRVTPRQKKEIILALKKKGHVVSMTGDGVNDVLSLKEADCSIAMNSGSDAARNVSKLVLLNSDFEAMPSIVLEGRQTVNNIERSATLFLTKTMYASLLLILFLFINRSYPFEPIHLTLTSVVAIGIPSFVLALESNKNRIKGNFFTNVFSKAFPFSVTIVLNIISIMILTRIFNSTKLETSTLCVIMNAYVSFLLLFRISRPFNRLKLTLFISMILIFIIEVIFFKDLFSLAPFNLKMIIMLLILFVISNFSLEILSIFAIKKLEKKYY